jgi:Na+-driven multidrug efflux pump
MRIVQAGFLPVVALGFAVAPVAGQNFGARHPERVRATFRSAAFMAGGGMILFTAICRAVGASMIGFFSSDEQVVVVGEEYLRIVSWTFAASGVIFVVSSMFQALGHTLPALMASFSRIVLVAIPAFFLARMPGFQLHWIWWLSVGALIVQLALGLLLLRREMRLRLNFAPAPAGLV